MQSLNLSSVVTTLRVLANPSLAVPHMVVRDMGCVNWLALSRSGFKFVAFDKDNTLTAPYVNHLNAPFKQSLDACINSFGRENVVIVSNSAGCDDPGYAQAWALHTTLTAT